MAHELPQQSAAGPTISGWAISHAVTNRRSEAHCFDRGLSLCVRWTATIFDRPAPPGTPRCSECEERRLRDG